MNRITKAVLCAAASVWASTASAATFYTYDVSATGTGTISNSATVPTSVTNFGAMFFRIVVPAIGFDSTTATSISRQLGTSYFSALGTSTITATATNLTFNLNVRTLPNDAAEVGGGFLRFDACLPSAGPVTFPTSSFTPLAGCGGLSFLDQGSLRQTRFTGSITSISISSFEATSAATGLIAAAIPEPSTWALMLAGFGLVGYAMRRRARVAFA